MSSAAHAGQIKNGRNPNKYRAIGHWTLQSGETGTEGVGGTDRSQDANASGPCSDCSGWNRFWMPYSHTRMAWMALPIPLSPRFRLEVVVLDTDRLVCLQHGRVAPLDAYLLVRKCEDLGITLADDGGVLDARGPITEDIDVALRRLKWHVLAILKYHPSDRHLLDAAVPFPEHGPVVKGTHA